MGVDPGDITYVHVKHFQMIVENSTS
uniref:Uncharacterized protein n=1 Tax=Arundo donax TaxID=35708 RepID=A0A0A9BRQ9_ARUDO